MFALGGAIVILFFFAVTLVLQILSYKISFAFLFKSTLENLFEEIDSKKITSKSIWIFYSFLILSNILISIIFKIFTIEGRGMGMLLHSIIPFCALFHYHWQQFILKNEDENKLTKVFVVFYFAFLPFALMMILQILFLILFFLFF